jgi:hypothetical protein
MRDARSGDFNLLPRPSSFKAVHPVTNLSDSNGNNFVRITATPSDNFSNGGDPLKLRSELSVGGAPGWGSVDANRAVTYDFSVRLPAGGSRPSASNVMQTGSTLSTGQFMPALRLFWDENRGLWLRGQHESSPGSATQYQSLDFGKVGVGQWVHFTISVYWSLDPAKAKILAYVNGQHAGTMTGLPTIASPLAPNSMGFKIGTYGHGAAGSVDFDNIGVTMGLADGSGCP